MHHHDLPGVASKGQLALFDERYVGWPGDVTATWWARASEGCQGVPATLRRALFWLRVAELLSNERVLLSDALAIGVHELAGFYAASEATAAKALTEVRRLVRYAQACGVEYLDELGAVHVEGYMWAATRHRGGITDVSPRTAANRQAFVRKFLDVLTAVGVWTGDDIVGAPIPRGVSDGSRPLTSDEMRLVEAYSGETLFATRRPILVALAQAGGSPADIAAVTAADLDPTAGTVTFGGEHRRTNPLTPWGHRILVDYLAATSTDPDRPLCVVGSRPSHRAAHSVTVGLREALVAAGVAGRPGVTARSIALAAAAGVLDRDGIAAAARFLGSNSLDATAVSLGFDWQAT